MSFAAPVVDARRPESQAPRWARCLAVGPAAVDTLRGQRRPVGTIKLDGIDVPCGVVLQEARRFDAEAPAEARSALVRARAFSCNYRDRVRILAAARRDGRPCVIGSEFAGVVLSAGAQVTRVKAGDRVIGDNAWPEVEPQGWRRGVPTNRASLEYLVLPEEKLFRIPAAMRDEEAAAFGVGAQTAYSMVRKLSLPEGAHVLVTASASNTSLFAIAALRRHGLRAHAVTTSEHLAPKLRAMGVESVFVVRRSPESWAGHEGLGAAAARLGGFAGAVDPFFDLHLAKVLPLLAHGGRYVSCGLTDGEAVAPAKDLGAAAGRDLRQALALAQHKNISLIGNCCGQSDDLARALDDFASGRLAIPLDSVFRGEAAAADFLERTFVAPERFGKVVFAYDEPVTPVERPA